METTETQIGLTFRRIRSHKEKMYSAAEKIFMDSFPLSERRPLASIYHLLREEERFYFVVVSAHCGSASEPEVVGILVYWDFSAFLYVEYLATRSDLRGRSLGRRIMEHLFAATASSVVLEAEPAEDDLSGRRIRFYERMGFVVQPDEYVQPSYGVVPGIPLKILRRDTAVSRSDRTMIPTRDVIRILHREVYGVADDLK